MRGECGDQAEEITLIRGGGNISSRGGPGEREPDLDLRENFFVWAIHAKNERVDSKRVSEAFQSRTGRKCGGGYEGLS